MLTYVIRRIASLIPTLFIIVIFAFTLIHIVPGDPVDLLMGDFSSPEAEAVLRAKLGLDRPLHYQLWRYLATVSTGDLGSSLRTKRLVIDEILFVFPYTLSLAAFSSIIAVSVAIPLGIYSARHRGSKGDVITMLLAVIGRSTPRFWLGILLMIIFSLEYDLFPSVGAGEFSEPGTVIKSMILPGIALGVSEVAFLARVMRSSFLDVLMADFIRATRAKGVKERVVLYKHALRNSLVPVMTVLGLSFGRLLGGSVSVEKVFSRPGIGTLLVNSIYSRDYPMVQGIILFFALLFTLVNLLVDLSYGFIDPRIRYE